MPSNAALARVPPPPTPLRPCVGCGATPVIGLQWCGVCWATHAPVSTPLRAWCARDVFRAVKEQWAAPEWLCGPWGTL